MKKIFFTTSWDDGSVNDLKLCELLNKYGVEGTFYIPKEFNETGYKLSEYRRRLKDQEIQTISSVHEIGAHSLTHRSLNNISEQEAAVEIRESKMFLERLTEKEIKMFCFPRGVYNEKILSVVKSAGYLAARTTKKLSSIIQADSFIMDVSLQCAPFPLRKRDKNRYYWRRLFDPLASYNLRAMSISQILSMYSWQAFSRSFFNYVIENGNYFHLFGHSWELEKYGMWHDLELFLKYVAESRADINFVTNSQLIETINKE